MKNGLSRFWRTEFHVDIIFRKKVLGQKIHQPILEVLLIGFFALAIRIITCFSEGSGK